MRQRRRFLSLFRLLTSLPAAVMFCHTFRPLCDAVAGDFSLLLFFFGDVRKWCTARVRLLFLYPRKTDRLNLYSFQKKYIYRERRTQVMTSTWRSANASFYLYSVWPFCLRERV
uniref:Uncharacterized protein n=1 Tax=Rhipicephalus appendiculatus TaxID=34631 RepID=A0A131YCI8_RHIAP